MATLNSAQALGLADRIGSLLPGKQADLTAVDLSALSLAPCYDPVSHLVYCAGRQDVSDVWIAGRRVLESGRLKTLNETDLRARALHWRERLKE